MMSRIRPEAAPAPRYGIAGPMVGAPYAVMLLETLVARGARRAIFAGWCGALAPELRIGDIVIPDGAVVDEGTSPGYGVSPGEIVRPDPEAAASLREAVGGRGHPVHAVSVWTTDAIFRETPSRIRKYRALGAAAVEMEVSALFTAARFLEIPISAILTVSDSLVDSTWRPGFRDPRFRAGRRLTCEVIAELCRKQPLPPKPSNGPVS